MAVAWLTYSWADNKDQTVDWLASELGRAGLTVLLDRWDLDAGARLWEQIGDAISDSSRTDAWMIYATTNSLASNACKEDLYIAVNRALDARGGRFPISALFPSAADLNLLPSALKIRLNVSLEDNDWIERVVAGVEGREPAIARAELGPYAVNFHRSSSRHFIEIRPRAGTVSRFFVAVPWTRRTLSIPLSSPDRRARYRARPLSTRRDRLTVNAKAACGG